MTALFASRVWFLAGMIPPGQWSSREPGPTALQQLPRGSVRLALTAEERAASLGAAAAASARPAAPGPLRNSSRSYRLALRVIPPTCLRRTPGFACVVLRSPAGSATRLDWAAKPRLDRPAAPGSRGPVTSRPESVASKHFESDAFKYSQSILSALSRGVKHTSRVRNDRSFTSRQEPTDHGSSSALCERCSGSPPTGQRHLPPRGASGAVAGLQFSGLRERCPAHPFPVAAASGVLREVDKSGCIREPFRPLDLHRTTKRRTPGNTSTREAPGKKGCDDRFHAVFKDRCLDRWILSILREARLIVECDTERQRRHARETVEDRKPHPQAIRNPIPSGSGRGWSRHWILPAAARVDRSPDEAGEIGHYSRSMKNAVRFENR